MSPPATGTRRPRLLPAALLASGLVVATAATVLAATARPERSGTETCGAGREWVTVRPVGATPTDDWQAARARIAHPQIAGCVDTRQLAPTDVRG